jgi:hypothetical protein
MKIESVGNQRGEVMIAVMVGVMVVMMLFGGMHMMHGAPQHADNHNTIERKHDHQKDGMHCMEGHSEESHSVHSEETGTQK